LRSMGSGMVIGVTADTLTATGTNWQAGALKGMKFAPDSTQARYFTVVDNDATSLRIDPAEGDLTQATASGLSFNGVYPFTKVSVLGKGRLNSLDRFAVSDELLIDGSTLIATGINANRLTLRNGALLSQWRTTTSQEFKLDLAIGTLSIDGVSKIDASSRGYLGAWQGGNNTNIGRWNGNNAVKGSSGYNGGSYGGYGALYGGGVVGQVYGDPLNPNESGSGGGSAYSGYKAGSGGGLICIKADTISLDGSIIADGQTSGSYGGGGSGGGIRIDAGTLSGAGYLYARGGSSSYGGGGGGRISIYYGTLTLPQGNVIASGAASSQPGFAGTVIFSLLP
jgi:large repetitive protein